MNKRLKIVLIVVAVIIVFGVFFLFTKVESQKSPDADGSYELSASELSSVDTEVLFNDYGSMFNLSKEIQNGYAVDRIVRIDGIVLHPATKYSITEQTENGSKSVGTEFEIVGTNVKYPEDGARVVITGKVVEKSEMYYIIKTLPEFVEIKD